MFLSIALTRVAPVLFPGGHQLVGVDAPAIDGLDGAVERIRALINGLDADGNVPTGGNLMSKMLTHLVAL
jgi:hypothetical protein